MLDKYSITEVYPQPSAPNLRWGSYISQVNFNLRYKWRWLWILLPQPPGCCDHRHEPPSLDYINGAPWTLGRHSAEGAAARLPPVLKKIRCVSCMCVWYMCVCVEYGHMCSYYGTCVDVREVRVKFLVCSYLLPCLRQVLVCCCVHPTSWPAVSFQAFSCLCLPSLWLCPVGALG